MCQMMVALLLGTMICLNAEFHAAEFDSTENNDEESADEKAIQIPHIDLDGLEKFVATTIIEDPWSRNEIPIVYIEDNPLDDNPADTVEKRSRYYRRYPWKRVTSKNRKWENETYRYLCSPTRDDLFQLLVAIHEAREGDLGRTVRFCNRKRPASSIFTNIRFLGKRK